MVTINHYTLLDLEQMLEAQIDAEKITYERNNRNYIQAFDQRFKHLNPILRNISGKSLKGGTYHMYLNDSKLVIAVIILAKYKKFLFTDKYANVFIVNSPKWLYQYLTNKNITTEPYNIKSYEIVF